MQKPRPSIKPETGTPQAPAPRTGRGRRARWGARRRWRVRAAHARAYVESSALIALAVATGAWLARVL
jgi:hypothetical protein